MRKSFRQPSDLVRSLGPLVILLAMAVAGRGQFGGEWILRAVHVIRDSGPNQVGVDMMVQNYYEQVLDFDRGTFNNMGPARDLWRARFEPDADEKLSNGGTMRPIEGGYLHREWIPGVEGEFLGVPIRINRWGMRDQDYEKSKPEGVFRIAFVGASNAAGRGVAVEDSFPWIAEERLNKGLAGKRYSRIEVLNFSVDGYHMLERLYVVDQLVAEFEPDLILCTAYLQDMRVYVPQGLARRVRKQGDLRYDFLKRIVEESGIKPTDSENKAHQRFTQYRRELMLGSFEELKLLSEKLEIPVAVVVLRLDVGPIDKDLLWLADAAESLLPTLPLFGAYEGQDAESMYIDPRDRHPTPLGHKLIADELFEELLDHWVTRGLILGDNESGTDPST